MSLWDSPDLLQRLEDLLGRPSTDAVFTSPYKYRLLTQAEGEIKPMVAQHFPDMMWSAPALMTSTADKVFTLGSSVTEPLRVQILSSLTGRQLKPGAYWDADSDYVWDGVASIRMTRGREVTFPDGAPYARVVTKPTTIDASTASGIFPERLRILLVYRAAGLAARRGFGTMEPQYYEDAFDEAAWGLSGTGNTGLIGSLKTMDLAAGEAAITGGGGDAYWRPNG